MRIANWRQLLRLQIAVLYGLAMALLPLAHQPLRATAGEITLATLDDGTTVEICSSTQGGAGKSHASTCDACRLTSSPGLFTAALALLIGQLQTPQRIALASEQLSHPAVEHSQSQPRAPPVA